MGKLSNAKKLTNAEKYAIEGMYNNNMSSSNIAKALGRNSSRSSVCFLKSNSAEIFDLRF